MTPHFSRRTQPQLRHFLADPTEAESVQGGGAVVPSGGPALGGGYIGSSAAPASRVGSYVSGPATHPRRVGSYITTTAPAGRMGNYVDCAPRR